GGGGREGRGPGGLGGRRRVGVVAKRRGQRHLVACFDLDGIKNGRQIDIAGRRQQLGQGFDLGLELAGRQASCNRRVALGPGLSRSGLHRFLGNEGTSLDVG